MKKTSKFQTVAGLLLSKIAAVALVVGDFAIANSCTLFFHEEELPKELQTHHPFLKNENL